MNERIISAFLEALLTYAFFATVFAYARRRPPRIDPVDGTAVLKYGWFMRAFALFAVGLFVTLLIGLSFDPPPGDGYIVIAGFLAFLAACGFSLLLNTFTVQVRVSPEGLQMVSLWGRSRSFEWHEVAGVSYSRLNCWLVIEGPDRRKMHIGIFIVGVAALARAILRNVPYGRYPDQTTETVLQKLADGQNVLLD